MKVLLINSVCGIRSTGRICTDIAKSYEEKGYDVKIAYGREKVPEQYLKYAVRIGNELDIRLSAIHTRITDKHGFFNKSATKAFLKWADEYDPDVLWLHNLHGYYINVEMLFEWIKARPDMEVKWTLHDCWAFTGHCTHFSAIKCDKWKTKCQKCPQMSEYPTSNVFDSSLSNYNRKKAAFTGVENMTLITPSKWLAGEVEQSFLSKYSVEVINNSIDTSVFKPTQSDFREKNNLQDKKILLGVASGWEKRKGLYDFCRLAEMIEDDYRIVLVGLSERQIKNLPSNIIGIKRTNSTKELAEIYSAADVFVNLTYEDNYPTVNLEARACGLPIITYRTGGSPESAGEEAVVIEQGNIDEVYSAVKITVNKQ